ncbi:MAG: family 78 glycoside hydrolase catalytic domain [Clostridia bacterium]|nr:family 78 glycoside hydrolase catalytic domain [Clostridia bacterium]
MFFSKSFVQRTKSYSSLDEHVPAPYLRKKFIVNELPQTAEITICGLGFYELYVNGVHITKGYLAPYISNPDEILYYDVYRVEKYLKKGKNVVAALLGNGFLNNPGGNVWFFEQAAFRDAPKMALAMETDGELLFEADETFKTAPSPIIFDDFRAGEHYDARKEIEGWNEADFDDSDWANAIAAKTPQGVCRVPDCEPILQCGELQPTKIMSTEKGYIYCFPYNQSGLCRLNIRGEAGQEIKMTHGENILDGKLDMRTISFANRPPTEPVTREGYIQTDIYVCKGVGEEVYTPRFTYHGFQYVLVEGITEAQATPDLLTYLVINSSLKQTGKFSCSDEVINKLQEITCRSDISNFFYFPNDCPHREKNGWTGDAAISAEQILLNFKAGRSFKEWFVNARYSQRENGMLSGVIPTSGFGFDWGNGPAWDTFLVQIAYYVYKYEGDIEIVKENFGAIMKNLRFIMSHVNENGLLEYGLGDWCPPGRIASHYTTELQITDTLITLDTCYKAAKLASLIGETQAKEEIDGYYALLRQNFRAYYVENGKIKVEHAGQAGVAMALYYKAFEPCEAESAINQLLQLIEDANGCFNVGVLGGRVLFRVLSDYGRAEEAYKLITQSKYPSYKYILDHGATSLWENIQETDGDRMEQKDGKKLDSQNHHFWGDISAWFYKYIGGIRINPGLTDENLVVIKPYYLSAISSCHVEKEYKNGKIVVDWKRTEDGISLQASAPDGVKLEIIKP